MAWISGLADKAENILNKLDQNAATALSQVPETTNDGLRKSLSSFSLSPTKVTTPNMVGVKSLNVLQQNSRSSFPTSRRNSTDSKAESAITINVESVEAAMQNNATTSMSSSFSEAQELTAFKIALAEVSSERDELRVRLSQLNQDEENTQLKLHIQELSSIVNNLTEEREILQQEIITLQTANSAYVHSISELEGNLAKLQQEYYENAQKLQMQMKELSQQRQDFQEYRLKAQHTLQMKDNLIEELKTKGSMKGESKGDTNNEDEINNNRALQLENETMREELSHIREERSSLQNQLELLQKQWQELSLENTKQISELRENDSVLRNELRLARERLLTNESEQRVLNQEIYTLRQQYHKQVGDAKMEMQEKELEIQRLKNAKSKYDMDDSNVPAALNDAETRLRALTQALVDKQNTVENITAERNALRIQLEKLTEENAKQANFLKNIQGKSNLTRNALISNSTDDAKAQYPLLLAPNPFDNRVARRVKKAYSSLDSAGARLGTFLRRYPLMRVFFLMYAALLHLWVMFVLFSSTPN